MPDWTNITLAAEPNNAPGSGGWALTIVPSEDSSRNPINCQVSLPAPGGPAGALPAALKWRQAAPPTDTEIKNFGLNLESAIRTARTDRCLSTEVINEFSSLMRDAAAGRLSPLFKIDLFTEQTNKNHPIHSYPWEAMCWDGQQVLRRQPVVHLVNGPALLTPSTNRSSWALVISTSHDRDETTSFETHLQLATRRLRDAGFSVDFIPKPTEAKLEHALKLREYDVLYIACHGHVGNGTSGELFLGESEALAGDRLCELLAPKHSNAPLSVVILCVCESARSGDEDLTFAMAPTLIRQGLARQVLGFTDRVDQQFGMAFCLKMLLHKAQCDSWTTAYFRARQTQNASPLYWPMPRFFINRSEPIPFELNTRRSPSSMLRSGPGPQQVLGRSLELAGLGDWLQRPEDCGLVWVLGLPGIGKTALVRELVREAWALDMKANERTTGRSGGGLRRSGPRELVWVHASELEWTDNADTDARRIYGQMLPTKQEPADTASRNDDAIVQIMERPGLLIVDGWPSDIAFPKLNLSRQWKVIVTARRLPPDQKERFWALRLADLASGDAEKLFAATEPGNKPRLFSGISANPLIVQLAAYALRCSVTRDDIANILQPAGSSTRSDDETTQEAAVMRMLQSLMVLIMNSQSAEANACVNTLRKAPVRWWHPADVARERMSESNPKEKFQPLKERAEAELSSLRERGLMDYDEYAQCYRLPPAIVAALPSG